MALLGAARGKVRREQFLFLQAILQLANNLTCMFFNWREKPEEPHAGVKMDDMFCYCHCYQLLMDMNFDFFMLYSQEVI